ncbi:MAG: PLP-dependent transferase [Thermoplasmata archaeon]
MNDYSDYQSEEEEGEFGSLTYPIFQTSAYIMPKGSKFRYTRENNPTVANLARKVSLLEHAESTTCFASGMGAVTTTLLTLLNPGSKLLIQRDVFSRSYTFSRDFLTRWGVRTSFALPGTENTLTLLKEKQDVVFVESITNPILRVNDIKRMAEEIHNTDGILVVDSTLSTPHNIKPIDLGADIVIHSASKFISGHNNVIAGTCSGKNEFIEKIDLMRRTLGPSLDPFSAFLVDNGIKTLGVRMERINNSAMQIAAKLHDIKQIDSVIYPGLNDHPDHSIASETMRGYGGVIAFRVNKAVSHPERMFEYMKVVKPANTLGGPNTVISHPVTMSHRSLSEEEKRLIGIDTHMFRLSIGLESPDDILNDIRNSLSRVTSV